MFFFFKQKTAYEMRISDWSSDVCSSDLLVREKDVEQAFGDQCAEIGAVAVDDEGVRKREGDLAPRRVRHVDRAPHRRARQFGNPQIAFEIADLGKIGRASCRERVCQYV